MPSSTDNPIVAPSPNGELIQRVQQLRLDDQLGRGTPRAGRGAWLPWVLCGLMAVAWLGVGVRYLKTRPAGDAAASGDATKGDAKSGGPAAPGELLVQIKGTVTPFLQINLSPNDVSGVVEAIYFKEGDRVKKDTLLGKIRAERYQNDYNAALASKTAAEFRLKEILPDSVRQIEKDQAEAEWAEAEAARVRAFQEVKRLTTPQGTGVTSTQDLERAHADLKGAEARALRLEKAKMLLHEGPRKERIEAARADLRNTEARLQEATRLLANCEIRAPIDGTILTKVADRGMLVSPMSFNVAAGLCSMADLSKLEIEIDVPESRVLRVKPGFECVLQADVDPSRRYRGVVDRVMPIADDAKNVVKVRIRAILPKGEEPGFILKPKMAVTATVYNRPFEFNHETDQPWDDVKK